MVLKRVVLPAPVRPDQCVESACLHGEVHPVDGLEAAESLGESLHREQRLAHLGASSTRLGAGGPGLRRSECVKASSARLGAGPCAS